MRSFQGKLRLADRPTETIGAGIEVAAGSMSLIISDQAIAAWPLDRLDIEVETDGFHFVVDGEEFVFVTRDASGFAEAVGILDRERQDSRSLTTTLRRTEPRRVHEAPIRDESRENSNQNGLGLENFGLTPARRQTRSRSFRSQLPAIDYRSRMTQLGIAVLVLAALLAIFARPLLAFALMGSGSLGLLLGTGAMLDPIVATRLPADITAGKSVLISVVLLLSGMLVLVL